MNEVEYDPELCFKFSSNNREEIEKSIQYGCYSCLSYGSAKDIRKYAINSALCPRCGAACVIPDSVMPATRENLEKVMRWRWK